MGQNQASCGYIGGPELAQNSSGNDTRYLPNVYLNLAIQTSLILCQQKQYNCTNNIYFELYNLLSIYIKLKEFNIEQKYEHNINGLRVKQTNKQKHLYWNSHSFMKNTKAAALIFKVFSSNISSSLVFIGGSLHLSPHLLISSNFECILKPFHNHYLKFL